MKNLFCFLCLAPFASCCQSDFEYKFQNTFQMEVGKYCISKWDCLYLNLDSTLIFSDDDIYGHYYSLNYSYKNGNKQLLKTMDVMALLYDVTLNSYQSKSDDSYVILLKSEGENFPILDIYYLKNGVIFNIGEWGIASVCKTCDYPGYSIKDIQIQRSDNNINFYFLKKGDFIDIQKKMFSGNWYSFNSGELIVSFNPVDGTVKRVEKRE